MSENNFSSIKIYKRVLNDLLNYKKVFLISILSMLVAASTIPLFALLTKPLINNGFIEKDLHIIFFISLGIIVLFLIRGISSFTKYYSTAYLSSKLVQQLREKMFDKILKLPLSFYHDTSSGEIISNVVNNSNQITDAGFNVITVLFSDGVIVLGLIIVLIGIDWKLSLIIFMILPVVAICINKINNRLRKLSKSNQIYIGKMTQILNESIDGIREIKIYNNSQQEKEKFIEVTTTVRRNLVKQSAASSLGTSITQFMIAVALAIIIYFSGLRASNGNFTAGDFVSFLTSMILIFDPVKRLTKIMQPLQRGISAAESVFNFLDNNIEEDSGKFIVNTFKDSIYFKDVSFAYSNSSLFILKNIELEIKKGQILAIVGSSGSGKTTLVNLIPKFYNVELGTIYFDGININNIELNSLRSTIALVSQDIFLFNDTIANNITYGIKEKLDEATLINALKISNSWEFVEELPKQIHTIIGTNGAKLSGGQRQRLAIARAILKNSPILILDEATSALDFKSEALVQNSLDKISADKTIIVIAHRISTVQKANKIIVLYNGQIVEFGTHGSLLELQGHYFNLCKNNFSKTFEN